MVFKKNIKSVIMSRNNVLRSSYIVRAEVTSQSYNTAIK